MQEIKANVTTPPTMGSVFGEIDPTDINMPKLNIVQGVGRLSEGFNPGQIVYDGEIALSDGATPIEFTILSARKQYIENLVYGAEARPRVFNTLSEVWSAGGTIEWHAGKRPSYVPVLHVMVLFKVPQCVEIPFSMEYKGEHYRLAVWTLRGMVYNKAGKKILIESMYGLPEGPHYGKWRLSTKREKVGHNSIFVPVIRCEERHCDDFVKFVTSLTNL